MRKKNAVALQLMAKQTIEKGSLNYFINSVNLSICPSVLSLLSSGGRQGYMLDWSIAGHILTQTPKFRTF